MEKEEYCYLVTWNDGFEVFTPEALCSGNNGVTESISEHDLNIIKNLEFDKPADNYGANDVFEDMNGYVESIEKVRFSTQDTGKKNYDDGRGITPKPTDRAYVQLVDIGLNEQGTYDIMTFPDGESIPNGNGFTTFDLAVDFVSGGRSKFYQLYQGGFDGKIPKGFDNDGRKYYANGGGIGTKINYTIGGL